MTRKEMTEIFALLLLAYPNAEVFKGGLQKLGPTITLWTSATDGIDFTLGKYAALKLIRESKYPPTIAEFRTKAQEIADATASQIRTAWSSVRGMLTDADTAQDAYNALAPDCRIRQVIDAMGGLQKLILPYPQNPKITRLNYDGFCDTYRKLLYREQTNTPTLESRVRNAPRKELPK